MLSRRKKILNPLNGTGKGRFYELEETAHITSSFKMVKLGFSALSKITLEA